MTYGDPHLERCYFILWVAIDFCLMLEAEGVSVQTLLIITDTSLCFSLSEHCVNTYLTLEGLVMDWLHARATEPLHARGVLLLLIFFLYSGTVLLVHLLTQSSDLTFCAVGTTADTEV